MEYYRILQRQIGRNTIIPNYPTGTEIWKDEQPIFVSGDLKNTKEDIEFLPFYSSDYLSSIFLLDVKVKEIWTRYQIGGRYRPCVLGNIGKRDTIMPYWFAIPRLIECIHENSEYKKNGDIETLCLDHTKIAGNKVFGVKVWHSIYIIISEDILEEMIQNQITEFNWKKIIVSEENYEEN